jgi:ATP-dependent DNA helicase RecQ
MSYGLADIVQQRRMIDESTADDAFKRASVRKLDALVGLAETAGCRRVRLLAYFGEASGPCGNCDNCLNPPRVWDGTVPAQQALSCVYRTGQRFGAGHVIDVLLGRATERVSQLGHDRLSTFGIGADRDERQWRAVFRQLVALGHLWADGEAFGALKLTQTARQVLKGGTSVMLREQAARPARVKRGKKTVARETAGAAALDSALLRALRAWRLGIAREHGVPAFVVFHDATLETIAALRPGTHEALRGVSGIGEKKLERYGEALLEVVRAHSV